MRHPYNGVDHLDGLLEKELFVELLCSERDLVSSNEARFIHGPSGLTLQSRLVVQDPGQGSALDAACRFVSKNFMSY